MRLLISTFFINTIPCLPPVRLSKVCHPFLLYMLTTYYQFITLSSDSRYVSSTWGTCGMPDHRNLLHQDPCHCVEKVRVHIIRMVKAPKP